jgi:hypothetical protein
MLLGLSNGPTCLKDSATRRTRIRCASTRRSDTSSVGVARPSSMMSLSTATPPRSTRTTAAPSSRPPQHQTLLLEEEDQPFHHPDQVPVAHHHPQRTQSRPRQDRRDQELAAILHGSKSVSSPLHSTSASSFLKWQSTLPRSFLSQRSVSPASRLSGQKRSRHLSQKDCCVPPGPQAS